MLAAIICAHAALFVCLHRLVGDGVLGLCWTSRSGWPVRHRIRCRKAMMRATSATGNRIVTISNRPAFDVYRGDCPGIWRRTDPGELLRPCSCIFPFGVVTVIDVLVRIP